MRSAVRLIENVELWNRGWTREGMSLITPSMILERLDSKSVAIRLDKIR